MAVGTLTTAANVVAARARIADVDDVEPAFAAPCAAASAVSRAVVENLASCFTNSRTSVRTLERDMASGRARASQWGLGFWEPRTTLAAMATFDCERSGRALFRRVITLQRETLALLLCPRDVSG